MTSKFIKLFVGLALCLFALQAEAQTVVLNRSGKANFLFGSMAFGSVTGSYTTLVTNTNSVKGTILLCDNSLNADVLLSTDASTNHFGIAAGHPFYIDLGDNGYDIRTSISIKHNGAAPASGSIFCTMVYR